MTFEDILDQALAMLQRRGRVTYGTLQRQFALDADALEALTDALLFSYPQIVDEDGRGLVWTGDAATTAPQSPAVVPPPSTPPPPTPNAASSRCCSVTWRTPHVLPDSSTRKTSAWWCALTRRLRRPSSSATTAISPSIWGTGCSSTSATRRPTKTMRSARCAPAWSWWRRCEPSIRPYRREHAIRRQKLYRFLFQCIIQGFRHVSSLGHISHKARNRYFSTPQQTERAILPAIFMAKCQFRMEKRQNSKGCYTPCGVSSHVPSCGAYDRFCRNLCATPSRTRAEL